MAGPGFEPDATIALPTAKIAVMGAEAAVNAVYANKIAELATDEDREAFVAAKREEYEADIDIVRLASELVIDSILEPEDLRVDLIRRFEALNGKDRSFSRRRHGVTPV
jgi:acetyl-CoA carboxylase carboxyltransferase component